MAFTVTYHSIAKNNIRNIYSGLPSEVRWRQPGFDKVLVPAQRANEQIRKSAPEEKFFNERYCEYDSENGIRIPRAPAFRLLNRAKVDQIVFRLSEPTISKRRRASDICDREAKRCLIEGCRKCRIVSAGSNLSRQQIDDITKRVSQPTVSANVRKNMRCRRQLSVPEVKESCEKCGLSPSTRFAREFSIYWA
ncbi:hypothetical protein ACF0H5_021509 [Mactra antiquata]